MGNDTTSTGAVLERESELARLEALVDAARRGTGRALVVEGPAGIGKTTLLRALRATTGDGGVRITSAAGRGLERGFALGIVRQLLEPLLPADDADGGLSAAACDAVAVLRGAPGAEPDPGFRTLHALYWLVVDLAQQAPLVLLVDDVHLADAASLRFVRFLVPRLEGARVGLVLAARTGDTVDDDLRVAELLCDPAMTTLRPRPLTEEAVRDLVARTCGAEPAPAFVAACRRATGGNPFLLTELLRELAAERVDPVAAAAEGVTALRPQAVARSVLIRIARIGSAAAAVARAVAILGDGCTADDAAELAGLDKHAAAAAADGLVRAGILRPVTRLEFVHPIVGAAVHADIPPREQRAAHGRAAAVLSRRGRPPEAIAPHLLHTDPGGDAATAETLTAAAGVALAGGAPELAATQLLRALREPPAPEQRPAVLARLGIARVLSGDDRAADTLREALASTTDACSRAGIARRLGGVLVSRGRTREAMEVLAAAHEEVAGRDSEVALRIASELLLAAFLDPALLPVARPYLDGLSGLSGVTPGERAALAAVAAHALLEARPAAEVAGIARLALPAGGLPEEAADQAAFWQCVGASIAADADGEVRGIIELGLSDARRRGSALGVAFALGQRCVLDVDSGDAGAAESDGRLALEAASAAGATEVLPIVAGALAVATLERHGADPALEVLREHGFDGSLPERLLASRLLEVRGRVLSAADRPAEALTDLYELRRREAAIPLGPTRWRAYAALAEAALGDHAAARELVTEDLRLARAFGSARDVGIALRSAALVTGGEAALPLFAESADVLQRSHNRLELAHSFVALGAALRRAGRRAQARVALERGHDLAHAAAATLLERRAVAELAAIGVNRRDRAPANRLTPSELRVARLAARGLTNREIAQSLVVTLKTVEIHLTGAYRKLGISSRRQLPEALEAPAGSPVSPSPVGSPASQSPARSVPAV